MKNKNILVTKQLLLNIFECRRFSTTTQFYMPARNFPQLHLTSLVMVKISR